MDTQISSANQIIRKVFETNERYKKAVRDNLPFAEVRKIKDEIKRLLADLERTLADDQTRLSN